MTKIRKTESKALDYLVEDILKDRDYFRRRHFEDMMELARRDKIIQDLNIEIGRLMGKGDSHG